MKSEIWSAKPVINEIIDIIVSQKGEILDQRLLELLKKSYSYLNMVILNEYLLKLETMGAIYLQKITKTKRMITLQKNKKVLNKEVLENLS
ncbi:MAG: hypothetical protein KAX10_00320 [Candidatus Lokiarchaeota archaeon]|nr:hypothetical protein [Candidatus Lokiarchaeota archaeon]